MPETQASTPLPGHWQCRPTCKLKRAAFNRRHRDFASQTFRQTPLARQCQPESTLRDARAGVKRRRLRGASTPATGSAVAVKKKGLPP